MHKVFLTSFCFVTSIMAFGQNPQFAPRDETYLDTSLTKFVNSLMSAIDARDKILFSEALDPRVLGVIGGDGGIGEFAEEWDTKNDSSLMWPLMKRAIELGGVFLENQIEQEAGYQFVFPYVYDMDLDIEDDYYSIGVITGKKVNLRASPDLTSPIKTKLTYDVVWFLESGPYGETRAGTNPFGDPEWYMVETYDRSNRGWVNWKYVYSPTWYRLFLYKNKDGFWKISAFLVGD